MGAERRTTLVIDKERVAQVAMQEHFARRPELQARYIGPWKTRYLEDTIYNLDFLATSVALESPGLFLHYLGWLKVLLASLRVPLTDVKESLEALQWALAQEPPLPGIGQALAYLQEGIDSWEGLRTAVHSYLVPTAPQFALARGYLDALLKGDRHLANRLVLDAVGNGLPIRTLYLEVFQPVLREVGLLWQTNQITVAHEHFITGATQVLMGQLYPHIFQPRSASRVIVATCVSGELHEVGMRMIADLFELSEWDSHYLGANMPSGGVVGATLERRADVLAISATLTTHLPAVEEIIQALHKADGARRVKVMVGGYPFNLDPGLWQKVGADAWAPDGERALEVALKLTQAA